MVTFDQQILKITLTINQQNCNFNDDRDLGPKVHEELKFSVPSSKRDNPQNNFQQHKHQVSDDLIN